MNDAIYIPLLMRGVEPFEDCWSLRRADRGARETPEEACLRKLEEDIGLEIEYIEQLFTYGAPDRDPRDRAISISHFALIQQSDAPLVWGSDSRTARWFSYGSTPSLCMGVRS